MKNLRIYLRIIKSCEKGPLDVLIRVWSVTYIFLSFTPSKKNSTCVEALMMCSVAVNKIQPTKMGVIVLPANAEIDLHLAGVNIMP